MQAKRLATRLLSLVGALLMLSSTAPAYYYYVHFASRFAPFTPIPEKFDLNALPGKTVNYFIADSGPSQLAPGDSFQALISEIRLAARTWNDVDSSGLRIGFGGLSSGTAPQNTPGIDVVFDDNMPPGLIALSGPMSRADVATGAFGSNSNAQFVPITRSILQLRRDLHDFPSFSDLSFTTLVHEFGHTLGLQHTLTSGTMSTSLTRSTTKAKPLSADDIAAISVLYPSGVFLANSGTISGRVTLSGAGVNLASVVAIGSNGPAVSALTNPDGSYLIQGIPAGQYYIYVHPLPPPAFGESDLAGIKPPKDPDGNPLPAGPAFDTVFFPGVKDPNTASSFFIAPGDVHPNINFGVNRRAASAVSGVTTFGYYPGVPTGVHPAPLIGSGTGSTMVATGNGLVTSNALTPGLSVNVLGQSGANVVNGSVKFYTSGYMQFDLAPTFGTNAGPRHLIFSANNDIYVLPAAVLLVAAAPPAITALSPAFDDRGNRAVLVTGAGFDATTRIFFDGAPASIIRQNVDGTLLVTPPPGGGNYRATVAALNGDGQSSLFIQSNPPAFLYDASDPPFFNVSPSTLTAGSEAMVEITGVNTSFVDGQVALGFGSSDVTVRRLWVTSANHIYANLSVNAAAASLSTEVSVVSGLQVISQPFGLQILPANARQVSIIPPILNAATGAAGVPSGGVGILTLSNLTAPAGAIGLTIGGLRAVVLSTSGNQVTFQAPAGLPLGPTVVTVQLPTGDVVAPVVMDIEPAPPVITAAFSSPGVLADAAHPAARGGVVLFAISGLPDPTGIADISTIHVNIGGIDHSVVSASSQNGAVLVQIMLNNNVSAGLQVPATVSFNGASSQPFLVAIR